MAKTREYSLGPNPYARGWFMIARASDVTTVPSAIRFFGRDMAIYRGKASGRPHAVDAYCPHMRVHIGRNTTSHIVQDDEHVEGDSIRCPAHGWRYGPDGKCNDIPYSDTIPKAACIKVHKVVERAGCIWMWHDAEGGAPDYDLPAFSEWDDGDNGWTRWSMVDLGTLPIHPQEIVDNLSDWAHFGPVHGTLNYAYFQNLYDGHVMRQLAGSGHRVLVDTESLLETDAWYTGPGILQCRMEGKHPSLNIICYTQVEEDVVQVWWGIMCKMADGRRPNDIEEAGARVYHDQTLAAFSGDFEIWKYKEAATTVLQLPQDGPFHKGRVWSSQFYNNRELAKKIQERVNGSHTTLAGKGFEREVA